MEIPVRYIDSWQKSIENLTIILDAQIVVLSQKIKDGLKHIVFGGKEKPNFIKYIPDVSGINSVFAKPIEDKGLVYLSNLDQNKIFKRTVTNFDKSLIYIGMPVYYPDREIFGTVSILKNQDNELTLPYLEVLSEFREKIELSLEMMIKDSSYQAKNYIKNNNDSDDRYRIIVENQNALVVKFDSQMHLIFVSPQYCKMFGKTEEELLGKNFLPLIHPEDQEYVNKSNETLKLPPYECSHEEREMTIYGWRWILWSNKAIIDENGKIQEVIAIGNDIHVQKLAELALAESEEKSKALSETSFESILFIDNRICVECNDKTCEMFGYSYEEIVGMDIFLLVEESYRDKLKLFMANPQREIGEGLGLRKDGTTFWAEFRSRYFNYKGKKVRVGAISDISSRKKMEEELRLSEEKFRIAFKINPDSININRLRDGLYLEINQGFTQLTGYTEEDVKGKTSEQINIWENPADRQKLVFELYEKGYCINLETKFRTKEGEILTGLMSASIININNEQCIINITRNVQQLKDVENELLKSKEILEKSEKRYKDIFNEMMDGLAIHRLIYDENNQLIDFIYVEVNPAFEQITGLKKEYVIGKTASEIDDKFRQAWIERYGEDLKSSKARRFENYYEKVNRYFSGIFYCPQPGYFAIIFVDITDKKKAEAILLEQDNKLKEQNEEYLSLNEELTQLNKELVIANKRAVESDRLKTAFLANMSHEIRTPMNGIIGFSGLLSREEIDNNKRLKYIEIIQHNCNQLLSIINDLVDISKIEAGQIELDPVIVNLDLFLQNLYDQYRQRASNSRIDFTIYNITRGTTILVDEIKLRQVFVNLIENAFKFTYQGSISFGYQIKENEIAFFVKDSGIGIDKEFHQVVFDRFRQVESSNTRKYGGTGLGLSICKAFIEKMGGKIWLDSESGVGTTFHFSLPISLLLKKHHTEPVKPEPEKKYKWNHFTILIAEDEPLNFRFFEEILEDSEVRLIWAKDGKQAIEYCLQRDDIDLVLMDIKMPEINGYDATREVKKHKPNLPIIAQTAYALIGDETKAKEAGCDGYIKKPINVAELMKLLSTYLNK